MDCIFYLSFTIRTLTWFFFSCKPFIVAVFTNFSVSNYFFHFNFFRLLIFWLLGTFPPHKHIDRISFPYLLLGLPRLDTLFHIRDTRCIVILLRATLIPPYQIAS